MGIQPRSSKKFLRFALLALCCVFVAGEAKAQSPDWKADWDRTVAAAKKEGALIISAPSGNIWREQLLKFTKEYDIALDVTPFASRDFWPRVIKEREAGQFLWDIRVGGADAVTYQLRDKGDMTPVRPLLVLPDVIDESKWTGGFNGLFLDNEKQYFPAFALFDSQQIFYNSKFIPNAPTIKDLSDPEWHAKIAMADPRGGASMNVLSVMAKTYGIESVKKLMADPQPIVTADPRQQLNWLITGRYPIAFGIPAVTLVEYGEKGGSIEEYKKVAGLKMWAPGVGGLQLLSKAPHPNATKVFVNWLLTRDVQASLMAAVKLNSRRNDVPLGSPSDAVDIDHISEYVGTQDEDVGAYAQQVSDVLRQVQK